MRKSGTGRILDDIDEWFNGNRKTTSKSAGSGGGLTMPKSRKPVPVAQRTKNIINGLKSAQPQNKSSTKKKPPQVIVKISGSSKGADRAQAHLDYISRNGAIELEDENSFKYKDDEHKQLIKSWQAAGMHDEEKTGTKKEAFHFVFSMPEGTDPNGLKNAVRNLVQEEFTDHKYFMALHLDTDKPHCHVLVSATDDRGARLNPRKQDLHNYRVAFVNKLAEQGIEATASRAASRFKAKSGKKQWKIHHSQRHNQPYPTQNPTNKQKQVIKANNESTSKAYQQYVKELPEGQIKKVARELIQNQKNLQK